MTSINPENRKATVYLGFGSNQGDRRSAIVAALRRLEAHPDIRIDITGGVASLFETAPVGGPRDQGLYLNTAVRLWTTQRPLELLSTILEVEKDLGRVRDDRWGPRVIDIDLLLFDGLVLHEDGLVVPHPRLHERRFVLEPLAEIGADFVHPLLGVSIASLALERRNDPSCLESVDRLEPGGAWLARHQDAPPMTVDPAD